MAPQGEQTALLIVENAFKIATAPLMALIVGARAELLSNGQNIGPRPA